MSILPRCVICTLIVAATALVGQAASVMPVQPPVLWQSAEFRLGDGPTASNPFDPDVIQVEAAFVGPRGTRLVVPAFWSQDFERSLRDGHEVRVPVGIPEWRVRFTPTDPGEYHVTITVLRPPATRPEAFAETSFAVSEPAGPRPAGWVRLSPDRRGFVTTDGHPLRLVGENVCWPERRGTFDYDDWFSAMQRSGMNFARLWCAPWWAPLEHLPGSLTNYRLEAAWELDWIFRAAGQRGIYLMLCFDHHGMFQEKKDSWFGSNNFWPKNPYNAALGGPCATPNDFFARPQARHLYEKRVRYLIARYGSSPNLLAWELLNEVDNVYGPLKAADVNAWHREVGQWLHRHDPYQHLVTSSLTGGSDRPEFWALPELDFSQYHSYRDKAPAQRLAALGESFLRRYHKPFLVGEFGTNARGWNREGDPQLRGLRQGLWGGALSGAVGTAMPWWWEDIHRAEAYPIWTHLRAILDQARWAEGAWTPLKFPSRAGQPEVIGIGTTDRAVVYVVSPATVYPTGAELTQPPVVHAAAVPLPEGRSGAWQIDWYDPQTGARVGQTRAENRGGDAMVPLPDFRDDLTGILTRPL